MSIKTASLCALIGMILNFAVGLYSFLLTAVNNLSAHLPVWHLIVWFLQLVLLNGSLIFFFAVLYAKQKYTPEA
jgi:energy-coupling factor transporter transmembrane protein EcfT